MPITTTTLRPGRLVSLKTSVRGNVSYNKTTIEADHTTADGELRARWETERLIADPKEHEAAIKVRSKVRSLVRSVCAESAFGWLCPETRIEKLDAVVAEARDLAAKFNATSSLTTVEVYVIAGRIGSDDAEAVKAINSELRDLMTEMENGLSKFDVEQVRGAANRAKALGQMLSEDAQEEIKEAIDAARATCRKLVQAGETAAREIDLDTLAKLRGARMLFLDMDGETEVAAPVATAGRAIDFDVDVQASDFDPNWQRPQPELELE